MRQDPRPTGAVGSRVSSFSVPGCPRHQLPLPQCHSRHDSEERAFIHQNIISFVDGVTPMKGRSLPRTCFVKALSSELSSLIASTEEEPDMLSCEARGDLAVRCPNSMAVAFSTSCAEGAARMWEVRLRVRLRAVGACASFRHFLSPGS